MKHLFFISFISLFAVEVFAQGPFTTCSTISAGSDDAEEEEFNGIVYLNSSDLELVNDPNIASGNQTVGLRFTGLNIPQGATITSAYIQFVVDELDFGFTALNIQGEDTDNPFTFSGFINNISNRTKTTAAVPWTPASWTVTGSSGINQRTPDLSSVVQEIVNRPGFNQSSALAFIITGFGERTAVSFDGAPALAPYACITYVVPPSCANTAANAFSSNISTNSAVLNWSSIPGVIGYRITGGQVGSSVVNINVNSATNSFTVGGLASNTSYNWIVQGLCSGSGPLISPQSNIDVFTTLTACNPPANIFTTLLTSNSVRLNWATQTGVAGYRITGNEVGQPGLVSLIVSGASASFADVFGLMSSTNYFWKVASICPSGGYSAPSATNFFNTAATAEKSDDVSSLIRSQSLEVSVFPNPASQYLYIKLPKDHQKQNLQLKVFTLQGTEVECRASETENNMLRLDFSTGLAAGIYHLELISDQYHVAKRVVLQRP